jgi:hypothetical protein
MTKKRTEEQSNRGLAKGFRVAAGFLEHGRSAGGRRRPDTLNISRWIWLSKERECLIVRPF